MPLSVQPNKPRKERRTRSAPSLGLIKEAIEGNQEAIERIEHKIWGNGEEGIITVLAVLKESMATKDDIREMIDALEENLMSSLLKNVSLAILQHRHTPAGVVSKSDMNVSEVVNEVVDRLSTKPKEEGIKAAVVSTLKQVNSFLQNWPIIYLMLIILMLFLGYTLEDILAFLRGLGSP